MIVALGDSITDGVGSTLGADHRWPDFLAERLGGRPHRLARRGDRRRHCGQPVAGGRPGVPAVPARSPGWSGTCFPPQGSATSSSWRGSTTSWWAATRRRRPTPIIAGYRQIIERAHRRAHKGDRREPCPLRRRACSSCRPRARRWSRRSITGSGRAAPSTPWRTSTRPFATQKRRTACVRNS